MARTGIHPIVAPVLIGIWLILVWSAVESARSEGRDARGTWLAEAHRWASPQVRSDGLTWVAVHIPPECPCAGTGLAEAVQELRDLGVRTVEGAPGWSGHQLVLLQPDGAVAYAAGPLPPQAALCSASAPTAAELLKSGWLSADNPVLDAPASCACPPSDRLPTPEG